MQTEAVQARAVLVPTSGEYAEPDPLAVQYSACVSAVGATGFWVCAGAGISASIAKTASEELFPTTQVGGTGDAFRHCYWSALLTIDFGAVRAEKVTTSYEDVALNDEPFRSMDLANNATGRQVGLAQRTNARSKERCASLARTGGLVTVS
ncbi:DUF6973 domain-containing protein [Nocardioides solisilvae]|uniref:DUF6973 domain-containing protein n=1 Tax=Nocardioides solisilvae TaxID=1542435 RepID=UPI0013A59A0D|nr:hypothetical protein [Nocardioides solisilvae]